MKLHDAASARNRREKSILLAIASSFFSKFGGITVQLVAMPLVVRRLGTDNFALYTLATSAISFVTLAQIGFGGCVAREIAAANGLGQFEKSARVFWTSLAVVTIFSSILTATMILLANGIGLGWLWGPVYLANSDVLKKCFYVVASLGWFLCNLSIVGGAQNGYLEGYIGNLYIGVSSFLSAAAVLLLATTKLAPTLPWFVALIFGPQVLMQLVNAGHFLFRHREMRIGAALFDKKLAGVLLISALGFGAVQTLMPLVHREFSRLALARNGSLAEVAEYGALMQLSLFAIGILATFTQPLFVAVADANAHGDKLWIKRQLFKAWWAVGVLFLGALILGWGWGQTIFTHWLGANIHPARMTFLYFAVYLGVTGFIHVNVMTLLGAGDLRGAGIAAALEMSAILGFTYLIQPKTASIVFISLVTIQVCTSGAVSALRVKKILNAL